LKTSGPVPVLKTTTECRNGHSTPRHRSYRWQGFGNQLDMIEIQVDRGAGYSLLTYDTTPGYTDTAPFPATPAKWTYKAVYRKDDSQVGQWSNPVSITVGG
jgi:hypothetical protein